jgi:hypothetical protein
VLYSNQRRPMLIGINLNYYIVDANHAAQHIREDYSTRVHDELCVTAVCVGWVGFNHLTAAHTSTVVIKLDKSSHVIEIKLCSAQIPGSHAHIHTRRAAAAAMVYVFIYYKQARTCKVGSHFELFRPGSAPLFWQPLHCICIRIPRRVRAAMIAY